MKPPVIKRILDKLNLFKFQFYKYYYSKVLQGLGKDVQIYGPLKILCPEKVIIGNNCSINECVLIHGAGSVKISDSVTISAYAKIISTGLDLDNWDQNSDSGPFKKHINAPIFINAGAWIGTGVIILPGVEISGTGVVIAAGSVVTKSIKENNVVYGGIPARKIKEINTGSGVNLNE
jgi:acetyltransferase-like isoleucine patch superfamily enzyme